MDKIDVCVAFLWTHLGAVLLDTGNKVKFPKTGSFPGLYRFEIKSSDGCMQYIGETEQMARRLQHYRTPGPSQQTNLRINALLLEHLKRGDHVSLSVVMEGVTASCGGHDHCVDLTLKSDRLLLESAALMHARASGIPTLNL